MRESKNYLFVLFLTMSLVTHLFLFFLNPSLNSAKLNKATKIEKKRYISIRTILKSNMKEKQIVKSSKTENEKIDPNSKFLGMKNQVVKKETKAKRVASFSEASRGKIDGVKQKNALSQNSIKQQKKILKKLTFDKLSMDLKNIHMDGIKNSKSQNLAVRGETNGHSKTSGLNQNNDFLEDVPMGDMTYLNTVEYKYFGFYDRIRKKLEIHWGSTLEAKTSLFYKSGRRMPATENALTSLIVILNSKGSIVDVRIRSSSGFQLLDEAAIESFNKAGPFPNPPLVMLQNGRAEIRWGFVVNSV